MSSPSTTLSLSKVSFNRARDDARGLSLTGLRDGDLARPLSFWPVSKLNDIRDDNANQASTSSDTDSQPNRVDQALTDVFSLVSLFFLVVSSKSHHVPSIPSRTRPTDPSPPTFSSCPHHLALCQIGKSRTSVAGFCQLASMRQLLSTMNESGVYTEGDLQPYSTRLAELREVIRQETENDQLPPGMEKLLTKKLEDTGQLTSLIVRRQRSCPRQRGGEGGEKEPIELTFGSSSPSACVTRACARRAVQVAVGSLGRACSHPPASRADPEAAVESGCDGEAAKVRGQGPHGGAQEDRQVSQITHPSPLLAVPVHLVTDLICIALVVLAANEWTESSWGREGRLCRPDKRQSRPLSITLRPPTSCS